MDYSIQLIDIIKELFLENRESKSLVLMGFVNLIFFELLKNINFEQNVYLELSTYVFYLGLTLFVVGVILFIFQKMWSGIKILYFKNKFPLKHLTEKYYLVRFSG